MDNDLISRAEALSVFKPRGINDEMWKECDTYKKIVSLPSIQPKKVGHWEVTHKIDDYDALAYKCSECGNPFPYKTRYCANCGSRMNEVIQP